MIKIDIDFDRIRNAAEDLLDAAIDVGYDLQDAFNEAFEEKEEPEPLNKVINMDFEGFNPAWADALKDAMKEVKFPDFPRYPNYMQR